MKKKLLIQQFADELADLNQPVITNYTLGVILQRIYNRRSTPPVLIDRYRLNDKINELHRNGILSHYRDYSGVHKIFGKPIESDEEVVCSINPFAYISHLSAMEYHGLTDRIPRVLIYSVPDAKTWQKLAREKMMKDFQGDVNPHLPKLNFIHIKKFQKKSVIKFSSRYAGSFKRVQDRQLKVATIGKTFLDMIRNPELCDGIYNVIEAYEDHAEKYLNLITAEIERHGKKIDKIRAGWIIEERCGIKNNPAIESWKEHVQRGGSQKLDPSNEYAPVYSDVWCLSLNIEDY